VFQKCHESHYWGEERPSLSYYDLLYQGREVYSQQACPSTVSSTTKPTWTKLGPLRRDAVAQSSDSSFYDSETYIHDKCSHKTDIRELPYIVWRERNQQDATNQMFIIKRLSQHVSGIIMSIIRRKVPCTTAYGVVHWLCRLVGCGCVELRRKHCALCEGYCSTGRHLVGFSLFTLPPWRKVTGT